MRFDPKIGPELNLTFRQQLFVEVWFNQVHEHSLDAFRVRAMNPINSVREILRTLVPGSPNDDNDRRRIWGEAFSILSTSTLLLDAKFQPACGELQLLLKAFLNKKNKSSTEEKDSAPTSFTLIEAFTRELEVGLAANFIPSCIQWLSDSLAKPSPVGTMDPATEGIEQITGQLLSTLVGEGWSLESLFALYRRTFQGDLAKNADSPKFDFDVAVRWMFDRLILAPKPYIVTFAISQVSRASSFPPEVGDINFTVEPPVLGVASSAYVKRYAQKGGAKLFATMTVHANDGRIAGMRAALHIEQVLDVVRYDFERRNFSLSDRFLVKKEDRHMLLDVSRMVPNPKRDVSADNLYIFMRKLGDLVSSGTLEDDSKERIYSAFRLYRTGAETGNLENKLMNWWTALEFLISKGGSGGIGNSVESALYPTVTLAYVAKHLEVIREVLHSLRISGTHPATKLPIDFNSISLADLYECCLDTTFRNEILGTLDGHPYAVLHIKSFFDEISTPLSLANTLKRHQQCVRWQIQRIYRARCDIVHSAGRVQQATLLCANLESYLKILLDTFLQSLHRYSTLRSPREFFDRQRHALGRISEELSSGKNALLVDMLRYQGT